MIALYDQTGHTLPRSPTDTAVSAFNHFLKVYDGKLGSLEVAPIDEKNIYVGVYTTRETLPVVFDKWPSWMVQIRIELHELLDNNPDKAILHQITFSPGADIPSVYCLSPQKK